MVRVCSCVLVFVSVRVCLIFPNRSKPLTIRPKPMPPQPHPMNITSTKLRHEKLDRIKKWGDPAFELQQNGYSDMLVPWGRVSSRQERGRTSVTMTSPSYKGGLKVVPSSLGVAVSSLGSRLSLGLRVLSEEGVTSSERGGVSGEPSCCPLGVAVSNDSVGVGGGVLVSGWVVMGSDTGTGTGSVGVWGMLGIDGRLRGVEFCIRDSLRPKLELLCTRDEVFSTRRHCMMLVSLPPVETRWASLCMKLTFVTWLLWALYLWLGACDWIVNKKVRNFKTWVITIYWYFKYIILNKKIMTAKMTWGDWPWVGSRGIGKDALCRSHQPERSPSCCGIVSKHWYLSHLSPPAKHLLHSKHQNTLMYCTTMSENTPHWNILLYLFSNSHGSMSGFQSQTYWSLSMVTGPNY